MMCVKKMGTVLTSHGAPSIISYLAIVTFSPKYVADIEQAGQCLEPMYRNPESVLRDFKFQRINRTTRALNFRITNKTPIDADVGFRIDMEKWVDAGWTNVPFVPFQPNACDSFSNLLKDFWTDLMSTLGVENPNKCPLPPGDYRMDNYIFDTTRLSNFVPVKGRFRYRIVLKRVSNNSLVTCLVFVLNMEEDRLGILAAYPIVGGLSGCVPNCVRVQVFLEEFRFSGYCHGNYLMTLKQVYKQ
ncbi:hypothetical protein NQ318_002186 [Aromia moschata]|uniref:MD-2-related lipid-recognition domain-containing protein n=1 Tax=Aromia moschata TaxID=1265417 RepID=A0AAV8Z2M1_9CUCU|nr:hypothetical protein NQ318_002186 [Aromia moschata]